MCYWLELTVCNDYIPKNCGHSTLLLNVSEDFLLSLHRTFWYSHSSFTNRCTFINTLIKIYIELDGSYMFRSTAIIRELAIEPGWSYIDIKTFSKVVIRWCGSMSQCDVRTVCCALHSTQYTRTSTLSHKKQDFRNKKLLNIQYAFWFFLPILSATFLILRIIERVMIKNVQCSSWTVTIILARF